MGRVNLKELLEKAKYVKVREAKRYKLGTYEECEEMFKEAFLLVDKTVVNFEMLPEYREVILWMSDTKGKGLLMTGSNGRGKSTILTGVLPLIFLASGFILKPSSAQDLSTSNLPWAVAIDEMGQDSIKNDYGTKVDAVEYAISHCEDHMKLLILTSNLTEKQIIARYGIRVMDRIHRLCVIVNFKGQSYRKTENKL